VTPFERPPVVIRWIAQPDACDDCKQIAAGSPYERLPTWPGLGDTRCAGGVCRCAVEGVRAGNVMATAQATGGPQRTPAPAPLKEFAVAPAPQPRAPTPQPPRPMPPPVRVEATPAAAPRYPSIRLRAVRIAPLEKRWTLALGALIFLAVIVAVIGSR
jgi:cell division septation protein DedD